MDDSNRNQYDGWKTVSKTFQKLHGKNRQIKKSAIKFLTFGCNNTQRQVYFEQSISRTVFFVNRGLPEKIGKVW